MSSRHITRASMVRLWCTRLWRTRLRAAGIATVLAPLCALSEMRAQGMVTPRPPMSGHASADASQLLVNFVTMVNRDEVAMGNLVASKTANADLRAYAERMVRDHTNAQAAWAEKVPSWSLTIPDSANISVEPMKSMTGSAAMANGVSEVRDTTTGLRGGTSASAIHSANLATLHDLHALSGASLDKAYLFAQMAGHTAVLRELAFQRNENDDMQTLVSIFRRTVQQHQRDARKLQP